MKRSLKAILVASTLTAATAAYAGGHSQHGKHADCHGGKHGMQHARFEQKLDLSAEQKTAIDDIYATAKEQRKAMYVEMREQRQAMLNLSPADPDYESQVAKLAQQQAAQVEQKIVSRGATQAQIYAILTPEQRADWSQLKAEAGERAAKRHERSGHMKEQK